MAGSRIHPMLALMRQWIPAPWAKRVVHAALDGAAKISSVASHRVQTAAVPIIPEPVQPALKLAHSTLIPCAAVTDKPTATHVMLPRLAFRLNIKAHVKAHVTRKKLAAKVNVDGYLLDGALTVKPAKSSRDVNVLVRLVTACTRIRMLALMRVVSVCQRVHLNRFGALGTVMRSLGTSGMARLVKL